MSTIQRVCVFGGRTEGRRSSYADAAVELGNKLASEGLELVYGGQATGLLGLVARTVNDAGGRVLGFTLDALKEEAAVGELRIVSDLHQRKAEMARHADCFIALPGGYEAMDGLSEAISWAQLGIHDKPIGLLNVDGFFDDFLTFIDKAIEDGFVKPSQKSLVVQGLGANELLRKLKAYQPTREGAIPRSLWENVDLPSPSTGAPGEGRDS